MALIFTADTESRNLTSILGCNAMYSNTQAQNFQSNILPPSSWMKDDGAEVVLLLDVNVRAEHNLTTYNFSMQVAVPHNIVIIQADDNMNRCLS
jgi:nitrate reductase cytochrome c-type subunit